MMVKNDLVFLIKKIVEANDTTEYLRINPFYVNYRLDRQIELDEYMFAMFGKEYKEMTEEEKKILYPLCKTKDTERFKRLLLSYKTYLNELIPFLFNKVKTELNLTEDDIPFGFFCFEVHSN